MNNIRSTAKRNEVELDLALQGASWHDEFKDSAYIFVGGLPPALTEGDVITIFSQYGEVLDINLPRFKPGEGPTGPASRSGRPREQSEDANGTGGSSGASAKKPARRGFGFLLYEDQRSTVLAVDNLNGAQILERTIRVDHVKNYKQKGTRDDEGKYQQPEEQSLNAKPKLEGVEGTSQRALSAHVAEEDLDLEDPMAAYIAEQRRGGDSDLIDDEERRRLKEEKRRRKEDRERIRAERKARKGDGGRARESRTGSRSESSRPAAEDDRHWSRRDDHDKTGTSRVATRDRSWDRQDRKRDDADDRKGEPRFRSRSRSPVRRGGYRQSQNFNAGRIE